MSDEHQPTSVRLPAQLADDLEWAAAMTGATRSALIREAVREKVARLDRDLDTTPTKEEERTDA